MQLGVNANKYSCTPRDSYVERAPNEKPNDRNDRAIRVATAWYESHLFPCQIDVSRDQQIRIVLLTDDVANRELAQRDGLLACSGNYFYV